MQHSPLEYSSRVHVCILQTVLDPFKGANHLPLFAAVNDVRFTIVCNRSKAAPRDLPPNVEVLTVPGRIGSYYYGVADFLFARSVLRRYPATDPFWKQFQVLQLNQVMGPAFRRLKNTGVPLLFTIHHPVTADRFVAVEESGLSGKIFWGMKYAALVSFQKRMAQACDCAMTVSQTVADRLIQDYGCSRGRIAVIPNGVDGSVFAVDPSSPQFDVIAVGSFIHPRKGFRYLLEAYRKLGANGRRIADVGRRTESQRVALQSIPGITIHGTVDAEIVQSLIRKSSALISTSLYEGFGLSLIEALACGRPAFAFAGGAVPEVLSAVDASLVVPMRDTAALVARAEAFLELPEAERRKKGEQYRAAVLARYDITLAAQQLHALYSQMRQVRSGPIQRSASFHL